MAAIITSAGLQAMINAQATGTEKVKLSVMKLNFRMTQSYNKYLFNAV